MKEILDGRSFAQELRIGYDVERESVHVVDGKMLPKALRSLDGNGALFDDKTVAVRAAQYHSCHGLDGTEVRFSILEGRRAHTNENSLGFLNCVRRDGEFQSAGSNTALDQVVQVRFKKRQAAHPEAVQFFEIAI